MLHVEIHTHSIRKEIALRNASIDTDANGSFPYGQVPSFFILTFKIFLLSPNLAAYTLYMYQIIFSLFKYSIHLDGARDIRGDELVVLKPQSIAVHLPFEINEKR